MGICKVAILGCGTVGGGTARILLDLTKELQERSQHEIVLEAIVEPEAEVSRQKFNLPAHLFMGGGKNITKDEAAKYIDQIIQRDDIDLVIETIGGSNDFIEGIATKTLKAGKHLVTANKALLAERGKNIYRAASETGTQIGFEAAVCGAIPIIKTIKESFSGDLITSISGIMNGTSNYILSKMQNEGLEFAQALKLAQENGYAEADPTLDINGHDAGHKLIILMKLAFGVDVTTEQLSIKGIQTITKEDIEFAREINASIKLICFAKKVDDKLYATVCPMMVKKENLLAEVNGATNAVRFVNQYSGKHILIGSGAGSSETASSIVADVVFISRYAKEMKNVSEHRNVEFMDSNQFQFPYIISFETSDTPGVTGLITTCIGNQMINIDTVSHNRHSSDSAIFSIATMPCSLNQISKALEEMKAKRPGLFLNEPKIIPILY